MATEEGLKVVLQGDASGLVAAGKKGSAAMQDTAKGISAAGESIVSSTQSVAQSIGKAAASTQAIGKATGSAGGALTSFNRIIQDVPFGFIAIGNNITDFVEKLGTLGNQTGSVGGTFKALGGALLGAGGISLAISAVTSGITGLIQKYGDLGTALLAITGNLSSAQQAQSNYNDEVSKSVGKVEGEIAKVNAFISVARDESVARDQRLKAIKEVQKEYPGYLDNLSLENINSDQTAKSIDRLSNSLIRKAKIQAAQDRISEEFGKILDAQSKSVVLQASTWDLFTAALTSAGHTQSVITAAINSGIKNQGKTVSQAEANIASFQNLLNSLLKEDALDGVIGLGKGGGAQNIKSVADILKELNLELTAVDVKAQAFGATAKDLGTDKINAFKKAVEELLKIGIKPGSEIFTDLQKQAEEIQKFMTEKPFNLGAQNVQIPINIDPIPKAVTNITPEAQKKLIDSLTGPLNQLTQDINKIIETSIENGIVDISSAFGNALVTGDFSNIAKAFSNSIGGFMQEIGRALVATGIGLEAFKNSLKSLNGPLAIVAGVGLIAAGAAFKAIASKGLPSFATGGVVNGPTLAMVGDNPSGIEYMIPKEVLDRLGNRNDSAVTFTGRVAGRDIYFIEEAAGQFNSRIGG